MIPNKHKINSFCATLSLEKKNNKATLSQIVGTSRLVGLDVVVVFVLDVLWKFLLSKSSARTIK